MLYHWELDFGTEHVNIGTENDEPVWTYVHSWHHYFHQRFSFNHRCVMTVGLSRSSECSYVCSRKWWHPVQSWISLDYDRWCHLTRTHLPTWEWNLWCDDPMVYVKIHIQRCIEFLKPEYLYVRRCGRKQLWIVAIHTKRCALYVEHSSYLINELVRSSNHPFVHFCPRTCE